MNNLKEIKKPTKKKKNTKLSMRNLFVAIHVAVHKSKSHHIKIDLGVGDSHQNIFFQVE